MTVTTDDPTTFGLDEQPDDLPAPVPVERVEDDEARTALERFELDRTTAALAPVPGGEEMRSLLTLARVLADSNLVPRDLKKKPHDVALVLLTGRELGIAPTAALRSCYVVDGRVSLAPALKQSIVRDRGLGRVLPAPDNNADRATWIAYEPNTAGKGWVEVARMTVTFDDVKHVTAKGGGKLVEKDNWKNYRARMLSARCRGWLIDDVWPEAAFGLYSPDELDAFTDEDGQPIDVESYDHVPDGYRKDPPPAEQTIDAAKAEELRTRIQALPRGGRDELRTMFEARGIPTPLDTANVRDGNLAAAILGGIESRARGGEWGEYDPNSGGDEAPDEATDAVIVVDGQALCSGCEHPEDDCQCPGPAEHEPGTVGALLEPTTPEPDEPTTPDEPAEPTPAADPEQLAEEALAEAQPTARERLADGDVPDFTDASQWSDDDPGRPFA